MNEEDLVDRLSEKPELIETWLKCKTNEWHQEFYALLGEFLSRRRNYHPYRLRNLEIVRLSDGTYKNGKDCYFPSDDLDNDDDDIFPRVAKAVYSSGKDKNLQEKAQKFLEKIDVRDVGEIDRVKAILKQRYVVKGAFHEENHREDLARFIALVERDPDQADLFQEFYIFKIKKNPDDQNWWGPPGIVYLDSPYFDTGLNAYYTALGEQASKWALSPAYEKYEIDPGRLGKFSKAVGARTQLEVKKQEIPNTHPEYGKFISAPGKWTRYWLSEDYLIPELEILLSKPNPHKSRLIWRTMDSLDDFYLETLHRKNKSSKLWRGASSLVYDLREAEWVPQRNGDSFIFVRPEDALIGGLPDGFPYDVGKKWLKAIGFGETEKKKHYEQNRDKFGERHRSRIAKEMGYDNEDDAKRWAVVKKKGFTPEEVLSKMTLSPKFPKSSVSKLGRRQERLSEQLHEAPEKEYEKLHRSERTTRGKIDPSTYLRNWYTNDDHQMICQICQEEMPFRKRDGEYYFEAVEALSRDYLPKEHEAQFLALCPECAARYKEFVKNDEGVMRRVHGLLQNADELEIPLQLGDWGTGLRFLETHRQDIKTILQGNSISQ